MTERGLYAPLTAAEFAALAAYHGLLERESAGGPITPGERAAVDAGMRAAFASRREALAAERRAEAARRGERERLAAAERLAKADRASDAAGADLAAASAARAEAPAFAFPGSRAGRTVD